MEAQYIDAMSEADGSPSGLGARLDYVDAAFTAAFAAELAVNAYAHWFRCAARPCPGGPSCGPPGPWALRPSLSFKLSSPPPTRPPEFFPPSLTPPLASPPSPSLPLPPPPSP